MHAGNEFGIKELTEQREKNLMTPYIFALVAFRVVAAYVVAQILFQLTYMLIILGDTDVQPGPVHVWLIYGSCVIFGLGLWLLAPLLSRKATRELGLEEASPVKWDVRSVQRIALSLMGAWFIIQALPAMIFQLVTYAIKPDQMQDSMLLEGLTMNLVDIAVGLILVLGASFWSELLVRMQEFGLKGKTRN